MNGLHQPDDIVANRYRIVAPLGCGTMAATYEAEDLTNCQRVAIKIVSFRETTEWKILELFDREAKILQNLDCPGIPKYINSFQEETPDDRRSYLIQELASGQSLSELVKKSWRPKEEEIKDIARQLLQILDYLHSFTPPVIHRDIKPENIIRRPDNKIYLVDFGAVQEVYRNTLTRGGTFVGTLGYMPHEQFRGQVVAASDLYALGATLLFLLTGKSPAELPQQRLKINFRDRVSVSLDFADWLEKMLEPSVEDRFQSAREAAKTLASLLSENIDRSTCNRPQSSHIIISKSDRYFICQIPPRWKYSWLLLVSLGLFFVGGFIAFPIVLLLSTPFTLVVSIACIYLLRGLGSWEKLSIDRQIFTITSSFLGITYRRVQGQTKDIELVEVEVNVARSKGKTRIIVNLVLWEGIRKHTFGSIVSDVFSNTITIGSIISEFEKQWLADEISTFLGLEQLSPSKSAKEIPFHDRVSPLPEVENWLDRILKMYIKDREL
ncbi:MAG: serine/threonine-protein kinase [Geitlerinemataceae cyanobacterium]